MPGEVYTRGFIKSYAKFLNMEKDPAIISFFEHNSPQPIDKSLEKTTIEISERPKRNYRNLFLGVLAVLLVIWGAYNISQIYLANKSEIKIPPESLEENLSGNEVNLEEQNNNELLEPNKPQELELTLEILDNTNAKDACWIQAFVDDTLIFEGIMYEGEQKQLIGKENIKLTLGNAGVVNIKLGDKNLGTLGKVKEVVRKTFTLQDLE